MPVVDECHDLVVNAILWTALAFVAVGLRLFTRGFIVKRMGWDDYLMASAMVSSCSIFLSPDPLGISLSCRGFVTQMISRYDLNPHHIYDLYHEFYHNPSYCYLLLIHFLYWKLTV